MHEQISFIVVYTNFKILYVRNKDNSLLNAHSVHSAECEGLKAFGKHGAPPNKESNTERAFGAPRRPSTRSKKGRKYLKVKPTNVKNQNVKIN